MKPAPRQHPPVVARDALDEADFEQVMGSSRALAGLEARGARLLPDFRALLADLYAACAKLTVTLTPAAGLPPTAQLRATLVGAVVESAAWRALHAVSRLNPARAGLATLRLGEAVLAELQAGRLMLRDELEASWRAELAEDELAEAQARREAAEALAEARGDDPEAVEVARELAEEAGEEAEALAGELARLRAELVRAARGVPNESLQRLQGVADRLPERLEAVAADEAQLGLDEPGPASGGAGDAVDALELGERLADSEVLRRLSRMVGALRGVALAERRKRVPRARGEVYGIEAGRDLSHLLPVELVGLRHPVLGRDFRRRFVEGRLLSYAVRGDDDEGRGPCVIALDLSGSMAGAKGIWAKAVALVLADLARRDGRAVTVLTFSSGANSVARHDLVPDRRYASRRPLDRRASLSFAETRVGGGTDFAAPLALAADIIRTSRRHRRGDVVLVTDGEASLPAADLEAFDAFKRQTDSKALGLLVDLASHEARTLERLCDRVVPVSALTEDGARKVFRAFDGR